MTTHPNSTITSIAHAAILFLNDRRDVCNTLRVILNVVNQTFRLGTKISILKWSHCNFQGHNYEKYFSTILIRMVDVWWRPGSVLKVGVNICLVFQNAGTNCLLRNVAALQILAKKTFLLRAPKIVCFPRCPTLLPIETAGAIHKNPPFFGRIEPTTLLTILRLSMLYISRNTAKICLLHTLYTIYTTERLRRYVIYVQLCTTQNLAQLRLNQTK